MPATISELLQGKPAAVTSYPHESIPDAMARMVKHDYSQLPVVDDAHKPMAIITTDSIARALNNFGVTPLELRVLDAMEQRIVTCRGDDDLLDLLDDLQREPAVLVVDPAEGRLLGILTSYDTTAYFRRRAQDIMLVQDIEETIKDYVSAAFKGSDGAGLSAAIDEITPSNAKELRGAFGKALGRYLELSKEASFKIDNALAQQAFEEHIYRKEQAKPFEKLTLNDYIELLLSTSRWPLYEPAFRLDRKALKRLLVSVRDTRNDLAHFRNDISEEQREKLRFCKDWLARHTEDVMAACEPPPSPSEGSPAQEPATEVPRNGPQAPVPAQPCDDALPHDEVEVPADSRYAALSAWLEVQAADSDSITVSLDDIEHIIGDKLPASAREHRSWWGNNPKGHTQSRQWLDVGWRVAGVSFRSNTVIFTKNIDRESAYRDFFGKLQAVLRKLTLPFVVRAAVHGSWMTVAPLPETGPRVASLNFAFARMRRFRVELYIDTTDKDVNKRIFDALKQRVSVIEKAIGETLHWERIDEKRASRIAIYFPGAITDDESQLAELRQNVADSMTRFGRVMAEHLGSILTQATMVESLLVVLNTNARVAPMSPDAKT